MASPLGLFRGPRRLLLLVGSTQTLRRLLELQSPVGECIVLDTCLPASGVHLVHSLSQRLKQCRDLRGNILCGQHRHDQLRCHTRSLVDQLAMLSNTGMYLLVVR